MSFEHPTDPTADPVKAHGLIGGTIISWWLYFYATVFPEE